MTNITEIIAVLVDNDEGDSLATAKAILSALGADETRHKVRFFEDYFVVEHPLIERLEGSLFDCEMTDAPDGIADSLNRATYWFWRNGAGSPYPGGLEFHQIVE
jgi:hypothetical protein